MEEYFEVGVRYDRTIEKGLQVKVTEQYLVDAMSFTEAEARITAEVAQYYTSGDFKVMTIKRSQISEITIDKYGLASQVSADAKKLTGENKHANSDVDRFYKVKVNWIDLDEKTLKEKRETASLVVESRASTVSARSSADCARSFRSFVR